MNSERLISISQLIIKAREGGFEFGSGNPVNLIHHYSRLGLLPPAVRVRPEGVVGHTVGCYREDVVGRLLEIQNLRSIGLSVEAIKLKLGSDSQGSVFVGQSSTIHNKDLSSLQFTPDLPEPAPKQEGHFSSDGQGGTGGDSKLYATVRANRKLPIGIGALAGLLVFFTGAGYAFLAINSHRNISSTLGEQNIEQVLAASVASDSAYLEFNLDTVFNGKVNLPSLNNSFTINTNEDTNFLTVVGGITLDQNLSKASSPTFSSLTLTAPTAQLNLPSGNKISLPDATGIVVLNSATQTLTNKTISGSSNTLSNIPNSALTNAKITINTSGLLSGGGDVALGSSISLTAALSADPSFNSIRLTSESGQMVFGTGSGVLNWSPSVAQQITIPDQTGTVCLSTGNCAGSGGMIGGGGTLNYIAKFTPDGSNIGNSSIIDNGSTVTIGEPTTLSNGLTISAGNLNFTGSQNIDATGILNVGTATQTSLTLGRAGAPTTINGSTITFDGTLINSSNNATFSATLGVGGEASFSAKIVLDSLTPQINATNNRNLELGFMNTGRVEFLNANNYVNSTGFYFNNALLGTGGASQWQLNSGVISPFDTSQSVALGATSTSSATIYLEGTTGNATVAGILGVGKGASLSAKLTLDSLTAQINATNNRNLDLGFANTGRVEFLNSNNYFTATSAFVNTYEVCTAFGNCSGVGGVVGGSGTQNYVAKWNNAGGTNIGNSTIQDTGILISFGSNATASGTLGVGGEASLSAKLTLDSLTAQINATNNRNLDLGFANTGRVEFLNSNNYITPTTAFINSYEVCTAFGNCSGIGGVVGGTGTQNYITKWSNLAGTSIGNSLLFDNGNAVALGTTTPLADLDVRKQSGLVSIASVSGATAKAALVVDNSGTGDIFTASSSGLNRFVITQNGNVGVGTTLPIEKFEVQGTGTLRGLINSTSTNGYSEFGAMNDTGTSADRTVVGVGGTATGDIWQNKGYIIASTNLDGVLIQAAKSTGIIQFFTGGTAAANERFRVDSAGNVGIGTTTTSGGLLTVGTSGGFVLSGAGAITGVTGITVTSGNLAFTGSQTIDGSGSLTIGGTNQTSLSLGRSAASTTINGSSVVVNGATFNSTGTTTFTGGNVGIGTTTVTDFGLELGANIGPVTTDQYDLGSAALEWNNLYVKNIISSGTSAGFWQRPANTGILAPTNITDSLLIGGISTASAKFQVYGLSALNPVASISGSSSKAALMVDNTVGDLFTASSSGLNRFVITQNGNVGIGTTNPTYFLHISNSASGTNGIAINRTDTTGFSGVNFFENGTAKSYFGQAETGSGAFYVGGAGAFQIWDIANAPIVFGTNNTEKVRIDGAGNVGIGTTNPLAPLYVNSATYPVTLGGNGPNLASNAYYSSGWKYAVNGPAEIWGLASAGGDFAIFQAASGTAGNAITWSQILTVANAGNVGIGTSNPSSFLLQVDNGHIGPTTDNESDLGSSTLRFRNLYAYNINTPIAQTGQNGYWQRALGVLAPNSLTDSLVIGLAATPSGAITTGSMQIYGINNLNPVASISAVSATAAFVVDNRVGDLFTASSSGLNRFVITQNGNVGIGTTVPPYNFSIASNAPGSVPMSIQNTSVTGFTSIRYLDEGGNLVASFGRGNTSSVLFPKLTYITTYDNTSPIALIPNAIEALRATVTGNVGIGTTTPLAILQVNGASTTQVASVSASTGKAALLVDNTIGDLFTASSSGLSRFVITQGGNVGIGTTNPSYKLDVNGSGRFSNYLTLTSNLYGQGTTANIVNSNDVLNVNKDLGADVTASWSTGASGGTARNDYVSVLYNGKIYFWGGSTSSGLGTRINTVDIYDIATNTWSTGASGGTARSGAVGTLYNNKIYIWGGINNSNGTVNTMDIYDIAGNSWSTGTAGGTGRRGSVGVLNNGKIYFWSGIDGSNVYQNIIDIYNIAGDSWTTGTSGGTARYSPTAVIYNGKLYGWGGENSSFTNINTLDIYDLSAGTWTTGATGGTARQGIGSTLYNGKIYILGGGSTTVDIYNILSNSWTTGVAGGTARSYIRSTLYNGKIYDWAGNLTAINSLDIYDVGNRQTIFAIQENGQDTLSFQTGSQAFLSSGSLGFTGGNVGINTTVPTSLLDIRGIGTNNFTGLQAIASISGKTGLASLIVDNSGTGDIFTASSSGLNRFVITQNGNVGIGTTTPGNTLDVNGNISVLNQIQFNGTSFNQIQSNTNQILQLNTLGTGNIALQPGGVNRVTISNSGTSPTATIAGTTSFAALIVDNTIGDLFTASSSGLNRFVITQGGNVGIGSTAPAAIVDIASSLTGTNYLNITSAGSSIFSVSDTAITNNLPASFTAAGDVAIAYDINFTNPVSSYIKSAAPLYLQAGELFNSSDLTLRTFNKGNIIFAANEASLFTKSATVSGQLFVNQSSLPQAGLGTLAAATISAQTSLAALVVDNKGVGDLFTASSSGLNRFVITQNGNVGIGTSNPNGALAVAAGSGVGITVTNTSGTALGSLINSGGSGALDVKDSSGVSVTHFFGGTGDDYINKSGNLGIGTTTPLLKLDVRDSVSASAAAQIYNTNTGTDADGLIIKLGNTSTTIASTTNHFISFETAGIGIVGSIQGNGGKNVAYTLNGIADFGEYMTANSKFEIQNLNAGTIVCQGSGGVEPCEASQSARMAGVVSDTTGFLGGEKTQDSVIVGFVGQISVKIATDSGAITAGDAIGVEGSGLGKKITSRGYIVGRAVESWQVGQEKVLVYVHPGYYEGDDLNLASKLSVDELQEQVASLASQVSGQWSGFSDQNLDIATIAGQLTVLGKTQLAETSIGGSLQVGLLHFDDLTGAISSLNGTITADGNLAVTGAVTAKKYNVDTSAVAAASAGKVVIPAGQLSFTVNTTALTSDSLIFATPVESPVAISARKVSANSFQIQLSSAQVVPLTVNWWIVN